MESVPTPQPSASPADHSGDVSLVERALSGDVDAISLVRDPELHSWIVNFLQSRGASATEAGDVAADLFSDCFEGASGKPSLLTKYQGKGSLKSFLGRAALNRFITLKRHHGVRNRYVEREVSRSQDAGQSFSPYESQEVDRSADRDVVTKLLRDAIERAYAQCSARELVILRLVLSYGVGQVKMGNLLGWSQSKISRTMAGVATRIREHVLAEVREFDPYLTVEWEDILSLCQESLCG